MKHDNISIITSLAAQQKRPWRTSIHIDGQYWRSYDTETVEILGLYEGLTVTHDELEKLAFSLEKRRAFNRAVKLLSYRSRSLFEIKERLTKTGFDNDIVDAVIKDLDRLELSNDESFAQDWARNRLNVSHFGGRRIKLELKQKGIPEDIINDALDSTISRQEEFETAMLVAEKKLRTYKDEDKQKIRRRLSQFLQYRGFESSIIYEVCSKLMSDM